MANSTTQLDLLSAAQASKEVTVNALIDAASPCIVLGRRASTTSGLVWGYYGGTVRYNSALAQIANGTVALTANTTNYIEFNQTTGAIEKNTTGWKATGMSRMYKVVTGASGVTSYEDWRDLSFIAAGGASFKSLTEGSSFTANTVSGSYTLALGQTNTVSGTHGYALGHNNTCSGTYSFGIGYYNTMSHGDTFSIGESNTSGATFQVYLGFYHHKNIAAGTGKFSVNLGSLGIASRHSSMNFSAAADWNKTVAGNISHSRVLPSLNTTNATPTNMNSVSDYNTTTPGVILRNSTSNAFRGFVVAKTSGAGTNLTSVWEVKGVAKVSSAGAVSFVGTPSVTLVAQDAGASAWALAVSSGTNLLHFTCTGAASTSIYWTADIEITDVLFA